MKYNYSKKDFQLAEKYTKIVLGVDELYRKNTKDGEESFSKEGLIPVSLCGIEPKKVDKWDDAREELKSIYQEYKDIDNTIRANYMTEQIFSVINLGNWVFNQQEIEYRNLVKELLYVNPMPVTEYQQNSYHKRLDKLLSNKNYYGSLEYKLKAWRKDNLVNKNNVEEVLTNIMKKAKKETYDLGFKEIENVKVKPLIVTDVPYQAYCDYFGGEMHVNGDLGYTYQDLKHLICHETFPGHTTHMHIRKVRCENGDIPLDSSLVFTNTASSPLFEGIADNGLKFINWMENDDDEISDIFQKMKSAAALTGAYMLHEQNKSDEEVKIFFKRFLFLDDEWINSRMRFIKHKLRKPFIYAYYRGNEAVYDIYTKIKREEYPSFLNYLYNNMHSVNTIKQFKEF